MFLARSYVAACFDSLTMLTLHSLHSSGRILTTYRLTREHREEAGNSSQNEAPWASPYIGRQDEAFQSLRSCQDSMPC